MKIQNFSQQGKRSNNEDSVGYNAGLLTVCDGIGGHVSGERASAFVVNAMLQAFDQPRPLGKMDIQQQLNKVQTDLNQLLETEPELEKMGTTFTGIFITPDVWYAAHIGDSRIYLFRPSEQKLWHTWDHSLVGELMRTHEITIEAGRFHPMSNRIAKAIIAQKEGKLASASIVKIDQLKPGDIFMLCSDGVVEGWGDLELVKLFSDPSLSFEQKCQKLRQQCAVQSKDNNTALIAEIEESDVIDFGNNDELEWTTFAEVEADYQQFLKDNQEATVETPTPQPVTVQPVVQETPAQPVQHNPQPAPRRATPKAIRPSSEKESPLKRFLIPILVALAIALGVGIFLLVRGGGKKADEAPITPETPIEDIEITNPANEESGPVLPSREDVEEARRRAEEEAYARCTSDNATIADCENYLNEYGNGRYVNQVTAIKDELKAYERCTSPRATVRDCDNYLTKYRHGRFVDKVREIRRRLQSPSNNGGGRQSQQQDESAETPITPAQSGESGRNNLQQNIENAIDQHNISNGVGTAIQNGSQNNSQNNNNNNNNNPSSNNGVHPAGSVTPSPSSSPSPSNPQSPSSSPSPSSLQTPSSTPSSSSPQSPEEPSRPVNSSPESPSH